VALSHYCCRTTLQCQCHETVLKLSVDRVRQWWILKIIMNLADIVSPII